MFPFSNLTTCRHCGYSRVARQATECPRCHGPDPGAWSLMDHFWQYLRNPLAPLFQHILPLLMLIVVLAFLLSLLQR